MVNGIPEYILTEHAQFEMRRRGITEIMVKKVLSNPEQTVEVRPGRLVLQSRTDMGKPEKPFLIRVFVDIDRRPAEVGTAYLTAKVAKYWRER